MQNFKLATPSQSVIFLYVPELPEVFAEDTEDSKIKGLTLVCAAHNQWGKNEANTKVEKYFYPILAPT